MTTECPHCGQRLRGEWVRCPRCRQLVPERPAEAAEPIDHPQSPWMWVGAAAIGVIVLAIGVGVVTSGAGGDTEPVRPLPGVLGSPSPPPGEPRPIDSSTLAQHQSEDERRAGYAAYAAGDLDAALARYQAAVDAKPDDPEARNNLAQLLVRQNRAADALPHFDEAIQLDPEKWAYRFNRARAYAQINRLPESIADYRAASELFPDDYATHYNLGLVYLRTKQYPEAVQSFEQAVSLAPGEPSFLISLGTAYVAVEQPDKAKGAFEQFLEVAADDDPEVPRVKLLIEALDAALAGA
jgi:Flp pilus assembly protein TadD